MVVVPPAYSSHSTVVPVIRTNGSATPVCQSWGVFCERNEGRGDSDRAFFCWLGYEACTGGVYEDQIIQSFANFPDGSTV
jgi:hypothetical protein